MSIGSLASVADWLDAVNRADGPRLERLTHEEIEIVGPRGTGRTDRRVLSQWPVSYTHLTLPTKRIV